MLTYEKDVKPIKITAREACQKMKKETKIKAIVKAYEAIRETVDLGMFSTTLRFEDLNTCDLVFNELVKQGYNLEQKKVNDDWQLEVNWRNVDLDPNKKYILPMEGTYSFDSNGNDITGYAYKRTTGSWFMAFTTKDKDMESLGYTVTAKDIEEAPEWVKALEPEEIK